MPPKSAWSFLRRRFFSESTTLFATKKFNPWHQKRIYEYKRRDVADSFVVPKPLFDFFLSSKSTNMRARPIRLCRKSDICAKASF